MRAVPPGAPKPEGPLTKRVIQLADGVRLRMGRRTTLKGLAGKAELAGQEHPKPGQLTLRATIGRRFPGYALSIYGKG
jgi:hypothetical protein